MILRLPRDYKLYNCYRRLAELLGGCDRTANHVFMQLWCDLGYQVDAHGRSGRIQKVEVEQFNRAVNEPGAFVALLESKCVIPAGEEEYLCPMFEKMNRDLDADYIPPTVKGRAMINYDKKVKKHTVKAFDYIAKIAEDCWFLEDGVTKIDKLQMNRVILLIKMLDNLLGLDRRTFGSYTPGLIQAAYQIVTKWSDDKLHVVLRRLYFVKGTIKELPSRTHDALLAWEDLVWKVMPVEGYVTWSKDFGNETVAD